MNSIGWERSMVHNMQPRLKMIEWLFSCVLCICVPASGVAQSGQRRSSGYEAFSSVVSQKYDYMVVRVFGRWSLPWLSMRRGGSVGCSFQ